MLLTDPRALLRHRHPLGSGRSPAWVPRFRPTRDDVLAPLLDARRRWRHAEVPFDTIAAAHASIHQDLSGTSTDAHPRALIDHAIHEDSSGHLAEDGAERVFEAMSEY